MTEADYFRIAREQFADFDLCITRRAALDSKPYFVSLVVRGQMQAAQANTLPEALEAAFAKHGVKVPPRERTDSGPLFSNHNT